MKTNNTLARGKGKQFLMLMLVVFLAAACGACEATSVTMSTSCTSDSDCASGMYCDTTTGYCKQVNLPDGDADATDGDEEIVFEQAPKLLKVEGDDPTDPEHRFVRGMNVTGEYLGDDTEFTLENNDNAFLLEKIELEPTAAKLHFPNEQQPGEYRLYARNASGEDNVPVTILQGPEGPACDPNEVAAIIKAEVIAAITSDSGFQDDLINGVLTSPEITALLDPRCPIGYTWGEDAAGEFCQKLDGETVTDVVVDIGSSWIDRYEESCTGEMGEITGEGFAASCQSLKLQDPAQHVTWFQANMACMSQGKRLCRNDEWTFAAMGTPDNDGSLCNIVDEELPDSATVADDQDFHLTGTATLCVSDIGVYDMIGNVQEIIAQWEVSGGGDPDVWHPIFGSSGVFSYWNDDALLFGGDKIANADGQGKIAGPDNAYGTMVMTVKGGAYNNDSSAGIYATDYTSVPYRVLEGIGFRCCMDR